MKMRPNMGRPDASSAIPQVRQAKLMDYVLKLERQNRMLKQGLVPNASGATLKGNLDSQLPEALRPGNVGQLANVIWPYWITAVPATPVKSVLPGSSIRFAMTVSQEAAFIMTQLVKTVYKDTAGVTNYLDPDNFDVSVSNANDLTLTMRDASSSRMFTQTPIPLDTIGDPGNPSPFPTPMYIKENGVLEFMLTNNSGAEIYYPFITAFGYRIRISDYEKILSQVVG